MTVRIHVGDCSEVMATMDADSVDAICTDPPYGLEFMGRDWDSFKTGRSAKYANGGSIDKEGIADRVGKGGAGPSYVNRPAKRCATCGKQAWSGSPCQCDEPQWVMDNSPLHAFQAWSETWAREAFRVLKPGGHLLAFSGTRTSHRMVCAIEDAGFEIRDSLIWNYSTGFPKSKNLGDGRGSALKPAHEPICLARKPLIGTLIQNVERYSTGALNIDKCRITSGPSAIISAWEHEQYLCNSCVRDAANTPRLEARAIKESTATNSVAPTSSEREQTHPDVTDKTDTGCFAGPNRAERDGNQTASGSSSTSKSGKTSTDQSPPATSSITITSMDSTTPPKICSSCGAAITSDSITNSAHIPNLGRWPSNFLLSHIPCDANGDGGCREVGTKRVKGIVGGSRGASTHIYGGGKGLTDAQPDVTGMGYADADGMETVTAWECVEGCPVAMLDAQSGERTTGKGGGFGMGFHGGEGAASRERGYGDTGGASRFFLNVSWQPGELDEARFRYVPKASRRERQSGLPDGAMSDHPTIKPVALMRYLVRLVTPPGGTVLDPFMGGGTTGMACVLEGFDFIGIEQDAHYANDIATHRIAHVERHGERWLDAKSARDEPRHIVPSTDTPPKRVRGRCVGVRIGVPLIVPEDGDLTDLPLFATLEAS